MLKFIPKVGWGMVCPNCKTFRLLEKYGPDTFCYSCNYAPNGPQSMRRGDPGEDE